MGDIFVFIMVDFKTLFTAISTPPLSLLNISWIHIYLMNKINTKFKTNVSGTRSLVC